MVCRYSVKKGRQVKLLIFQARRFWWKSFSRTLPDVDQVDVEEDVSDAVVVFLHAEASDQDPEQDGRVFRKTLKHIKWVANKGSLKSVVLHSFTHLGGDNAAPDFANDFIERMRQRLEDTGYRALSTPFGYFCEWDLKVYGESMAKVFKEF